MSTMNVGLPNLNEAYKVLSVLSAKGIPKSEITISTPSDKQLRKLIIHEAQDNNQATMIMTWATAIGFASLSAVLSLVALGIFSMVYSVYINFMLLPIFVLLGIILGGAIGHIVGYTIGKSRTSFKHRKVLKTHKNVVLNFDLPDDRKHEIEASLRFANPVFLKSV